MDDIRAVMEAAGSQRAVLLGQADGVPAATVFASTFPDMVSGLVVYGASARVLPDEGYSALPVEAWEQVFDTFEARWGNPDEPAAIELITPTRVDDDTGSRSSRGCSGSRFPESGAGYMRERRLWISARCCPPSASRRLSYSARVDLCLPGRPSALVCGARGWCAIRGDPRERPLQHRGTRWMSLRSS